MIFSKILKVDVLTQNMKLESEKRKSKIRSCDPPPRSLRHLCQTFNYFYSYHSLSRTSTLQTCKMCWNCPVFFFLIFFIRDLFMTFLITFQVETFVKKSFLYNSKTNMHLGYLLTFFSDYLMTLMVLLYRIPLSFVWDNLKWNSNMIIFCSIKDLHWEGH